MNIVAVVLGLGVLGCADKSPQEQCQDLVGMICDRATRCLPGAVAHDQCSSQLEGMVGCERVRTASPDYDSCVSRVESQSCQALFPNPTNTVITAVIPTECHDVVDLMRTSSDQQPPILEPDPPSDTHNFPSHQVNE